MPIYFVAGGTLGNLTVVSSGLRSHEAVISASSGHIVTREAGAIESTGHKIIAVQSADGKLTPDDVEIVVANNSHFPHMAKPRLVYISNATELGTVYSKSELKALSDSCKTNNLLLFMDGARLATALSSDINDLTLDDVAEYTDIFWIGGTKAGALVGEAIVIPNAFLADDFAFHIKQRGALLAKGRLLGVQFMALFSDGLFFELSKYANEMAKKLSAAITANGYSLAVDTESNQIFPVLPNKIIERLKQNFDFYIWKELEDGQSVIRLVTSWATDEGQVDAFISILEEMST